MGIQVEISNGDSSGNQQISKPETSKSALTCRFKWKSAMGIQVEISTYQITISNKQQATSSTYLSIHLHVDYNKQQALTRNKQISNKQLETSKQANQQQALTWNFQFVQSVYRELPGWKQSRKMKSNTRGSLCTNGNNHFS